MKLLKTTFMLFSAMLDKTGRKKNYNCCKGCSAKKEVKMVKIIIVTQWQHDSVICAFILQHESHKYSSLRGNPSLFDSTVGNTLTSTVS
jgi:hypothetical protein